MVVQSNHQDEEHMHELAEIPADNADTEESRKRDRREERDKTRLRLRDRLRDEGDEDLAARLEKCSQPLKLVCTCCGEEKEAVTHCMARYCPSCQPLVVAERISKWGSSAAKIRWPLMLTLTIQNAEDEESLRRLKKSWAAFRRRKLIKSKIAGGLATFEITNTGRGWHPHIHALCDCRWLSLHVPEPRTKDSDAVKNQKFELARAELSTLWADQTGQEMAIVLAARVRGDRAIAEVCKYAAKGSDLLNCPTPIAPMLRMMKATRMLAGWGSFFPLPSPDEDEGPKVECLTCHNRGSYVPDFVAQMLIRTSYSTPT